MKTDIKIALELIDKGLSTKTLSNLTENQIKTLHKKLVVEQVTEVPNKKTYKVGPKGGKIGNVMVTQDPNTKEVTVTTESDELDETETDDVTDKNALGADALQNLTGQDAPHDANDMAPDGMDDDSDDNRKMMGMAEEKNKERNPWAICTAQLGKEFGTRERHLWGAKEKNKYERCVKDVKKSLKEGKNPVSLFLENEIMRIVEKNIPPRITKGDLVKYLSEQGPQTAPAKPTTKPGTKPGKPATRPRPSHPGKNPNPGVNPSPKATKPGVAPTQPKPSTKPGKPAPKKRPGHPGKNPNPGVNPSPKAVSPEVAKNKVIDLIKNILEK